MGRSHEAVTAAQQSASSPDPDIARHYLNILWKRPYIPHAVMTISRMDALQNIWLAWLENGRPQGICRHVVRRANVLIVQQYYRTTREVLGVSDPAMPRAAPAHPLLARVLDHDLGGRTYVDHTDAQEDCGMRVAEWLSIRPERVRDQGPIVVHSFNGPAAQRMVELIGEAAYIPFARTCEVWRKFIRLPPPPDRIIP